MIIKKKIFLTLIIFALLYTTLLGRAFYLQAYKRDGLIKYAQSQFIRASKLYPHRGQILDRSLTPMAINIQKFDIFAMPQHMKSYQAVRTLCKLVPNLNCVGLQKKLSERKKFTWLSRDIKLTQNQVQKIKKLDGIFLEEKFSRFYPSQQIAASVLGYVNVDHEGLAGIEYAFDEKLRGQPKHIKYYKDAKGRPVRLESIQFQGKGEDVVLSIDLDLQTMTEKFLYDGMQSVKGKSASAVVMDPETGEVLSMATVPGFNPNQYGKFSPNQRKPSILTDPFEPGSVFKILTIAAALEAGVITPATKYYCHKGSMKVGNNIITEAAGHKYEWLTVNDIFKFSSNIGTTKIATDLGYYRFNRFLKKLNVGEITGIELRGESKGIYQEQKKPSLIHLANLSFGQGVATTPLQIATIYAAIANDGVMVRPTILKSDQRLNDVEKKRVMSVKTARQLQSMLTNVVDAGSGSNAKISYFNIAGKTSTAQKVAPGGGYSGIIAGFIGFPLGLEKKYVVYVYVDEPKEKIYGNEVAAPIFQKILSYLLYQGKDINPTRLLAIEDEIISDQVNPSQAAIQRIKGIGTIPNFIGLDKISAQELGSNIKAEIEMKGMGIVVSQDPEPYSAAEQTKKIILKFKEPEL